MTAEPLQKEFTFRVDSTPLEEALAKLLALLPEVPQASFEILHRIVDAPHALAKLFRVDVGLGAAGAGEDDGVIAVTLQPADGFRVLLTALSAGNFDIGVVKDALGHEAVSMLGLATSDGDASPVSRQDSPAVSLPISGLEERQFIETMPLGEGGGTLRGISMHVSADDGIGGPASPREVNQ